MTRLRSCGSSVLFGTTGRLAGCWAPLVGFQPMGWGWLWACLEMVSVLGQGCEELSGDGWPSQPLASGLVLQPSVCPLSSWSFGHPSSHRQAPQVVSLPGKRRAGYHDAWVGGVAFAVHLLWFIHRVAFPVQ